MLKHVDSESIEWLVEHYREHNARLEMFLARSLQGWNRPFRSGEAGGPSAQDAAEPERATLDRG
jgi:hypothetical protein